MDDRPTHLTRGRDRIRVLFLGKLPTHNGFLFIADLEGGNGPRPGHSQLKNYRRLN